MEIGARVRQAGRLAVPLHVRQDEDVGMLGMVELVDDVRLGPAELPGEAQEPGRAEALAPENQHLGGEECIPYRAAVRSDLVAFHAEAVAELPQAHPCTASSCRMRAQASGGSASRPEASARRNSSLRWRMWRADCWPPTITKWSWWPLSHAMNTTPVV